MARKPALLSPNSTKGQQGPPSCCSLSNLERAAPELTHFAGEKDGYPQWSPDGSLIAFVAKRGEGKGRRGVPALCDSPDGGEARRVTNLATVWGAPKWFADGKSIAFISWYMGRIEAY